MKLPYLFLGFCLCATARAQSQNNLVANPGFEAGASGFSLPEGVATLDERAFKSGARSLKFSNLDVTNYKIASQEMATSGGATFRFSAQIKGENLVSTPDAEPNRGASVCLEWFDDKGNWLGGSYPVGKLGSFDWTRFEGRAKLPLNARKVSLGLYLRRGTTGTSWFDDLEIVSTTPPLRVFVESPAYRGLLVRGQMRPLRAQLSVATTGAPLQIRSQLRRGKTLVASRVVPVPASPGATTQLTISQPLPTLLQHLGDAPNWTLEVLSSQKVMASQTVALRVVPRLPRVAIAPGGAWQVEGKPWFPIGIYLNGEDDTSDANLALMAKAGFNTILNYSYGLGKDPVAFLNRAQRHGLKVIYSLKDFTSSSYDLPKGKTPSQLIEQHVRLVKNHPALLAWYLNDESGLEHEAELRAMQQQVQSLDGAQHPILHVLYQYGDLDGYYDLADALGVDPYPIPRFPFSIVSTWTQSARLASRGAKSAVYVPQAFSHAAYSTSTTPSTDLAPTLDELRCLVLLGLIERPNALIFYSFFDLGKSSLSGKRDEAAFAREWKNVAVVAREVRTLSPLLLSGTELKIPMRSSAPETLRVRALTQGKTTTLLLANADDKAAILSLSAAKKATIQSGNAKLRLNKNAFEIEIAPHDSAVVTLK